MPLFITLLQIQGFEFFQIKLYKLKIQQKANVRQVRKDFFSHIFRTHVWAENVLQYEIKIDNQHGTPQIAGKWKTSAKDGSPK
jgi:hypothetical protein